MSPEMERVRDVIAEHLDRIATLFKKPLLTLVVRAPDLADGDVVLTSDSDLDKAIGAIQKLRIEAADPGDEQREPPTKRFFTIDVGGCVWYSVVAASSSEAWRIFGEHVRDTGAGEDMLDDQVVMSELDVDAAAAKNVDDDGRRYPLTEAELGAVFCSEY